MIVDGEGRTAWDPDPNAKHTYVKLAGAPEHLAAVIESLMIAPPRNRAPGECE